MSNFVFLQGYNVTYCTNKRGLPMANIFASCKNRRRELQKRMLSWDDVGEACKPCFAGQSNIEKSQPCSMYVTALNPSEVSLANHLTL